MKIGTILLNTCVGEKHPYKYSVYTGQSNGKASFIYPYSGGINNGHYLSDDIGENKVIQPVGFINLEGVLKKAIENTIGK